MALRTPIKGQPLGTYIRKIRESQRAKGLRSKLGPTEGSEPERPAKGALLAM